jgi:hypothetical protein
MGPTGMLPSSSDPALGNITFDELAQNFHDQAIYLRLGLVSHRAVSA